MKDIINLKLLARKGFYKDGSLTNDYYDCYRLYAYFLLSYLNEIFHLTDLEEKAQKIDSPLKPLKLDDKDFYQKLSPLKFFYIRSFLYIEKLSLLDILFLKNRISSKKFSYDGAAKRVIEKSYKVVVKHHEGYDEDIVSYGDFSSGKFFAPNSAIVLGIRFDPQYEDEAKDSDEWLKQFAEKKTLVSLFIDMIEKEAENKNISLKVLEFDENSVKFNNNTFKSY